MTSEIIIAPSTDLAARAAAYVEANLTAKTRADYAQDWKMFERWCAPRGFEAASARDELVAVYLAWMADQGRAPATIERAWQGLYVRLRELDPDARKGEICRKVLRGIRRTSTHKTRAKAPLLAGDLVALLEHVGTGIVGLRNRAMLLVGFAGGFRRSELAALTLEDVAFAPEGLRIALGRSKTDQEGRGMEKGLARGRAPLCPVAALSAWIDQLNSAASAPTDGTEQPDSSASLDAKSIDKPLFPALDRWGHIFPRPITPVCVANVLKVACRRAGLDARIYGAHSLRAGFVTQAALHHKSLDSIMRQTGHRSLDQLLGYIRHAQVFTENASEGLFE